jgi:maleamate amidohydrolase
MTDQTEEQMHEFFTSRGFGLRMGFGTTPALIVVDLMNAFTDPTMPLGSPLDAEIDATNQLLDAATDAAIPTFCTVQYYAEGDFRDAGIWRLKQAGIATLGAGTAAVELDQRLRRPADSVIILKKYASAFFGTDLISRLTVRRIDTLLLAGCSTSGCVRATAVDALQYGIRPIVVREAVGDRVEAAHRQALFDLDQKYADVVSLDEALAYLRRMRESHTTATPDATETPVQTAAPSLSNPGVGTAAPSLSARAQGNTPCDPLPGTTTERPPK